jgi:hypothetical protein
MRKWFALVAVVALVIGVAACKKGEKPAGEQAAATGGKYAEVLPVVEKFVVANEDLAAALEKAASVDDVVAALNKTTETMKKLAPKMNEIGEKFPEFKQMENPPEELKPISDRMNAVMTKMMEVMMGKAAPFLSDPKVQEAQKAYNDVMATIK